MLREEVGDDDLVRLDVEFDGAGAGLVGLDLLCHVLDVGVADVEDARDELHVDLADEVVRRARATTGEDR
jgi:hypothetical protein